MGSFLTWLAEKRARVFVVATANDITSLPPELVRKGRFDEIFFVDLPSGECRAAIFRIHLGKRGIACDAASLDRLVAASEGFSGAEIEQAVVASLYTSHAQRVEVSAQGIGVELAGTRPLSIVLAESLAALRTWAADRTVPAS
jgi:SpoVK/Ycf46/Vps4 family AAA+-type ATPase